jgi:hypothetical protein
VLEPDRIRTLLDYDPASGVMTWRNCSKFHSEKNGQEAGVPTPKQSGKQYQKITIDGRKYSRSRLAFAWMTGRWPAECIDHINGNSLDDRWENLREATALENAWNHKRRARQTELPMGVRRAASGRFVARIAQFGRLHTIGTFDSVAEAEAAYRQERTQRYGQFA